MIERLFRLKEKGTDIKTEVMAGVTTFMTMAYIIFVNPAILSKAGMDFGAVMVATILASGITTILMGLWVNYPFALAPGMGLNAYFTYTVVMQMGYSWQVALGAVFISGICFLLLTFLKVRQLIIYAIPDSLKLATAAGIGLFIALIGLKEANIIVAHPATLVSLGKLSNPSAYMTVLGLVFIGVLLGRGIKGAVLWGIALNWILGLLLGFSKFQGIFSMPPDISPIFLQLDIKGALKIGFVDIIFAFLFVDLFDTTGTLVGVAHQGGFTDEKGGFPKMDRALTVDAVGTVLGSMLGTSTVTTYVESGAGVAVGGKTGLT
ncbi:MAG: NCS2 family permease, partial [Deltaproteobacteria bacterium]